jgi:hypothetical protein
MKNLTKCSMELADKDSETKIKCATLEKETAEATGKYTVATAKATHEAPARETTKQVLVSSVKEIIEYIAIVALCITALLIAAGKLNGDALAWTIAAIVGVFSVGLGGVVYINKKPPKTND